jgi:hypothetical protein
VLSEYSDSRSEWKEKGMREKIGWKTVNYPDWESSCVNSLLPESERKEVEEEQRRKEKKKDWRYL